MKILFKLPVVLLCAFCNNNAILEKGSIQTDSIKGQQSFETRENEKKGVAKLSVLVFPPFDKIASECISPNIQVYLEQVISNDTAFNLLKFPYKQLINVPYQNVFDKEYCKPVLAKLKTDIILMIKLDQALRTGQMANDKWNFQIKIFNTLTGKLYLTNIAGYKLTNSEMERLLYSKKQYLSKEISNTLNS